MTNDVNHDYPFDSSPIPSTRTKSKPKHIRKAKKRKKILLSKFRRGKITIDDFISRKCFYEPLFYVDLVDAAPPICYGIFRADTHECVRWY